MSPNQARRFVVRKLLTLAGVAGSTDSISQAFREAAEVLDDHYGRVKAGYRNGGL